MPDYPDRAITLKQPWVWAVIFAGKRIENRGQRITPGPRWLHAGGRPGWDDNAVSSPLIREAWEQAGYPLSELNPDTDLIPFGAVTALINFTGAHYATGCGEAPRLAPGHASPAIDVHLCDKWAAYGQVHNKFDLTLVLPEPVPCRGMPGMWPVPASVLTRATAQLSK